MHGQGAARSLFLQFQQRSKARRPLTIANRTNAADAGLVHLLCEGNAGSEAFWNSGIRTRNPQLCKLLLYH